MDTSSSDDEVVGLSQHQMKDQNQKDVFDSERSQEDIFAPTLVSKRKKAVRKGGDAHRGKTNNPLKSIKRKISPKRARSSRSVDKTFFPNSSKPSDDESDSFEAALANAKLVNFQGSSLKKKARCESISKADVHIAPKTIGRITIQVNDKPKRKQSSKQPQEEKPNSTCGDSGPVTFKDDCTIAKRVPRKSNQSHSAKSNCVKAKPNEHNKRISDDALDDNVPTTLKAKHKDEEDLVSIIAARKASQISLPPGIRSASDLKWWLDGETGRYYPCRICDTAEAMHVNLDPVWDPNEVVLIQALEFPPSKPFHGDRDRILVDKDALQDYGKGNSWNSKIWMKYNGRRLDEGRRGEKPVLSETDLKAGFIYLNRILKAAKEMDVPEIFELADDFNDSDLETPYAVHDPAAVARLPAAFSDKKSEPLRPGDVVEYSSPIYVAGNPLGKRRATVTSTNPNDAYYIRLSNNELLPNETKIKRVAVLERGKLYPHNGYFRQIDLFIIKKRALEISVKDVLIKQAEQLGKIINKSIAKLREKDPGLGDFVKDFGPTRNRNKPLDLSSQKNEQQPPSKKDQDDKARESDDTSNVRISRRKRAEQSRTCSSSSDDSDSDSSLEIVPSITIARTRPHVAALSSRSKATIQLAKEKATSLESHNSESNFPLSTKPTSANKSPIPILHNEYDSDSSMENQGLRLTRDGNSVKEMSPKAKALKVDQGISSLDGDEDSDSWSPTFPPQRNNPKQSEDVSAKKHLLLSIDKKTEQISSGARRFLPMKSKMGKEEISFSRAKSKIFSRSTISSKLENQSTHVSKSSTSTVTKQRETSAAQPIHSDTRSLQSDSIDRPIPQTSDERADKGLSPSHEHKQSGFLTKKSNANCLKRMKRKRRYIVEEDDIEDFSDEETRDSHHHTPKRKHGVYQPVARLSSCTKSCQANASSFNPTKKSQVDSSYSSYCSTDENEFFTEERSDVSKVTKHESNVVVVSGQASSKQSSVKQSGPCLTSVTSAFGEQTIEKGSRDKARSSRKQSNFRDNEFGTSSLQSKADRKVPVGQLPASKNQRTTISSGNQENHDTSNSVQSLVRTAGRNFSPDASTSSESSYLACDITCQLKGESFDSWQQAPPPSTKKRTKKFGRLSSERRRAPPSTSKTTRH